MVLKNFEEGNAIDISLDKGTGAPENLLDLDAGTKLDRNFRELLKNSCVDERKPDEVQPLLQKRTQEQTRSGLQSKPLQEYEITDKQYQHATGTANFDDFVSGFGRLRITTTVTTGQLRVDVSVPSPGHVRNGAGKFVDEREEASGTADGTGTLPSGRYCCTMSADGPPL